MSALTPKKEAYLRDLARSGYLPTLEENAKRLTAPFWWYDPQSSQGPRVMQGGTICFVHTGQRLLGITAGHVHAACVAELEADPELGCQIGSHSFEPERYLLDYDESIDIATYGLSEIQVNAARANIHYAPVWPPEVDEDDVYVIGGWPWMMRVDGNAESTHSFLNFSGRLSGVSDRQIGFATFTSTSVPWGQRALPPGTNLGGMSGGPLYRLREQVLTVMTLVGIISEYQPSYELVLARPLSLISTDGTIIKP